MKFTVTDNRLKIFLSGRIDSNNVAEVEKSVQNIVKENPGCKLNFDADELKYITTELIATLERAR